MRKWLLVALGLCLLGLGVVITVSSCSSGSSSSSSSAGSSGRTGTVIIVGEGS